MAAGVVTTDVVAADGVWTDGVADVLVHPRTTVRIWAAGADGVVHGEAEVQLVGHHRHFRSAAHRAGHRVVVLGERTRTQVSIQV